MSEGIDSELIGGNSKNGVRNDWEGGGKANDDPWDKISVAPIEEPENVIMRLLSAIGVQPEDVETFYNLLAQMGEKEVQEMANNSGLMFINEQDYLEYNKALIDYWRKTHES
jgi:hypothetical protein